MKNLAQNSAVLGATRYVDIDAVKTWQTSDKNKQAIKTSDKKKAIRGERTCGFCVKNRVKH
jgi:hypothetical protein